MSMEEFKKLKRKMDYYSQNIDKSMDMLVDKYKPPKTDKYNFFQELHKVFVDQLVKVKKNGEFSNEQLGYCGLSKVVDHLYLNYGEEPK